MLDALTIAQLLTRWSEELLLANLTAAPGIVAGSAEEVALLESRLGQALPPSYREFLIACRGIPVTGAVTAGFRPAVRVGWFRDLEAEWLQIWRDVAADPNDPGPDVELMARSLVVSEPGDQALLLDPAEIDAQTGEWPCYTFSNFAAGSHRVGTFRDGLDRVYRSFLAGYPTIASATLDDDVRSVESAYQAILAGDLSARTRLTDLTATNWRAWLLAAQYDAFGARPHGADDLSISVHHLWWGNLGGVSEAAALADPVVMEELIPLWIVRYHESRMPLDWEIQRAPALVAARITVLRDAIADGTGPVADFSYSPEFAHHIAVARTQLADEDTDAAWASIRQALPVWTPRSRNHLAPLGLYYDKDLRRALVPPRPNVPGSRRIAATGQVYTVSMYGPSPEPSSSSSISPMPTRKTHSDRTLDVLRRAW